ncbi:MAG: methionyl-tRNA formyltransferase [Dehalococcoidia bacterium]
MTAEHPTRLVFFGAPEYAVPSLRVCLELPGTEVVAVVTQPDRPRGRSRAAQTTPVKDLAVTAGVPLLLQPDRVRRDTTEAIAARQPDVGVVAASGHILPSHLLEVFPHGVLNVHASLLPRHRGASPVAAAILAGDAVSGASIMRVVRELDAGPVLARRETPIGPLDTTGALTARIADLGAALLAETLPRWLAGEVAPQPQDDALATFAPRLTKDDGAIDWTLPAEEIARAVRAYHPWPLATTRRGDDPLAILEAWPLPGDPGGAPGTVSAGDGTALTPLLPGRTARAVVACGAGALALLTVQRAGRRALSIEEYLNGDRALIGSVLGGGFE